MLPDVNKDAHCRVAPDFTFICTAVFVFSHFSFDYTKNFVYEDVSFVRHME